MAFFNDTQVIQKIKTTPMAPAGCHTHRHASRDSYYNSMNISYMTYRSFIIHHNFGHIRRLLLLDPARGEEKLRESSGSTTAWWWSLQFSGRASPSTTEEEEVLGRERVAPGAMVKLPCASPLYIGVEGAGFFPSKSIGALAKVGGKKSHPFPSPPIVIPPFRDLDLIPSGYDLIPSKGGSWCTLNRGVGPCPHYPRSCGSPHAGGPHSGTF